MSSDNDQSTETNHVLDDNQLAEIAEDQSLRELILSSTAHTIGFVVSIATLVSAVPIAVRFFGFLELSNLEQLLASVVLLLGFFITISVRAMWASHRELQEIREEAENRIKALERKIEESLAGSFDEPQRTFFGLSFSILLQEPPESYDRHNYLTYSKSTIEISEDRIVYDEIFEGYVTGTESSSGIPIMITVEAPMSKEDLDYEMWYKVDGDNEWMSTDNWEIEQLGKYDILITLQFEQGELPPNEQFSIRYRMPVEGWPMEGEQYVFIPQHRFPEGTENCSLTFKLDRLQSVDARRVIPDTSVPAHFRRADQVDFEMEPFDFTRRDLPDGTEVTAEDSNTSDLYIFRFVF